MSKICPLVDGCHLQFDISQVNTAACRLDFELLKKLNQVELENQIKTDCPSVLSSLKDLLHRSGVSQSQHSSEYLEKVLRWCPSRVNRLNDLLSPEMAYLWSLPIPSMKMTHSHEELERFLEELAKILRNPDSHLENLSSFIKNYATQNNLKFKFLMKDIRLLFCGSEVNIAQRVSVSNYRNVIIAIISSCVAERTSALRFHRPVRNRRFDNET